jgi:hypothetical protein
MNELATIFRDARVGFSSTTGSDYCELQKLLVIIHS